MLVKGATGNTYYTARWVLASYCCLQTDGCRTRQERRTHGMSHPPLSVQTASSHGPYGVKMKQPWQQGSWGQHGAHLGPTGPRWTPCWPHEPCYLGTASLCSTTEIVQWYINNIIKIPSNCCRFYSSRDPTEFSWITALHNGFYIRIHSRCLNMVSAVWKNK